MYRFNVLFIVQSDVDTVKVDDDDGKEVSIQVSVEMPFDIRSIECPTHKVKIKVCCNENQLEITW